MVQRTYVINVNSFLPLCVGFAADPNTVGDDEDGGYSAQPAIMHDATNESYLHEANMPRLFLDVIPLEISKKILYSLNIGPLMALLQANRRTLEFGRSYNFWRDYYLTHFNCIPKDILEAISITHGEALLWKSRVQEVYPTNVWQLALRTMKKVYAYDPTHFPQQDNNPLLQLVSESFPQLTVSYPAFSTSADGFIWFTSSGSVRSESYSVHKLGIQRQADGRYNAILLQKYEYVDHLYHVDQFQQLEYIFEWCQAENTTELLPKIKPLCEMFLLLRYNTSFTCHRQILPKYTERSHFAKLKEKYSSMHIDIEEHATKLSANGPADLQSIDRAIMKLKEVTPLEVDYNKYTQILPKRSEINAQKKYVSRDWVYDFHTGAWELPQVIAGITNGSSRVDAKQREKKRFLKVLVLRLIRLMLNYIMMPLLRAFWPQNAADPDFNAYNYATHQLTPPYKQHYSPYIDLSEVSISHGFPSHWPAVATAVAHLILGYVWEVVADLLCSRPADSSVSQLILALQTTGFHSKTVLDEIQTFFLSLQK